MAKLKTIICWGQSNMAGNGSLTSITDSSFERWTGSALSITTLPVDHSVPGVYYWTTRLPYGRTTYYGADQGSTITLGGGNTTVTVSPDPGWGMNALADRSTIVKATNWGSQTRRVVSNTSNTLTLASALAPAPSGNLRIELYDDSRTAASYNSTTKTITCTQVVSDLTAPEGKWLVMMSGASALAAAKVVSVSGSDIVIDRALTVAAGNTLRVLTGLNAVHSVSDISHATGAFRELRFYYDAALTFSTGWDWPNHYSMPRITPANYAANTQVGPDLELSWRMQHEFDTDIWVIKLGIPGAYMSKWLGSIGSATSNPTFSWVDPSLHNDWHPASTDRLTGSETRDLFGILMHSMLDAAIAWVDQNRSGDQLDVVGIFAMEGESDSITTDRAGLTGVNMRLIRDTMRAVIDEKEVSSIAASKIPFVIGEVRTTDNTWPFGETTNANFRELARDDIATGTVSTGSLAVNAGDPAHYTGDSQVEFGRLLFAKWQELRKRQPSATTPDDKRLTLSGLRERVTRRYEGSGASATAKAATLNQFINDAIRELLNTLGDNAWFLRRIESFTVLALQPVDLPRIIKRLLRIESSVNRTVQLPWRALGYSDNGRLRIQIESNAPAPYDFHHIIDHEELVEDEDRTLVPLDYSEMVVLLTCKRLAESTGNGDVAVYYQTEVERLYAWIKRDVQRYARQSMPELSLQETPDAWRSPGRSRWGY